MEKINIKEIDKKKFRAISDFRVVALLLYFNVECKYILEPEYNKKKKLFLFDLDENTQNNINEILKKYVNGNLQIEPRKLFGLLDRIKDIINSY